VFLADDDPPGNQDDPSVVVVGRAFTLASTATAC
jgi:hypothetical protein